MISIYGIANCDTVKKARRWLDDHGIIHDFHDFRRDGLDRAKLEHWLQKTDWTILLNRRGTSWRRLDETTKTSVSADNITRLLLENPTLIKRPVLEAGDVLEVGFNENRYRQIFHHG